MIKEVTSYPESGTVENERSPSELLDAEVTVLPFTVTVAFDKLNVTVYAPTDANTVDDIPINIERYFLLCLAICIILIPPY